MSRLKLGTTAALVFLVLIVIVQNTDPVDTKILFVTLSMPRALLLIGTTLVGFLIGVVWSLNLKRDRDGKE